MAKLKMAPTEQALQKMQGNVSAAARALGVSRNALATYIGKSAHLQAVLEDARQAMVDNAESALNRAVINGEAWAVCFTLKTQGKKRGYVERVEQTGPDGGPIPIMSATFDLTEKTDDELKRYVGLLAGGFGGAGTLAPTDPTGKAAKRDDG